MIKKLKRRLVKSGAMLMTVAQIASVSAMINLSNATEVHAATTRQMEALDRGIIGVSVNGGVFLSWRLLGTDAIGTNFNVYRDGIKIATVTDSTNYLDYSGSSNSQYYVRTVINNSEKTQSKTIKPMSQQYLTVNLDKPSNTSLNGETVTYSANDASVGDLDGDGEYEIILKWDPSNSKDNSQSGYTSNVYLDAYKLNGKKLWRIDLGRNIRAGAHYTQFMVYDLNGDGKAEIACKTADGTKDGKGNYIGDRNADYRNSKGYVLSGPEYLTVFSGETGAALTTIDYTPERGNVSSWGDNYGNRVDRFLGCVAYLDGKTPSLVMCRGYYTRTVIVAYDFNNNTLTRKWTFDTNASTNAGKGYDSQGNHNLSVGDVDGDGYDEIVYGSMAVDHNGAGLYTTKLGHGDAGHLSDFDPTVAGLEYFQVHEEKPNSAGTQMRSARTGKQIWGISSSNDIGRGVVANISSKHKYYLAWSSQGLFDRYGNKVTMNGNSNMAPNFAIWWDGDLLRELLDGVKISKWNDSTNNLDRILTGSGVTSCNGTKATPSLQADVFGDWREEVIWPTSDSNAIRIYTTTDITTNKFYTFMHDPVYRLGVAWQNIAYNQPPHTSFYVGPDMSGQPSAKIYTVGSYKENQISDNQDSPQKVTTLSNGSYYKIRNINSGKYLDVANGLTSNGTNIQQWTSNSATAQIWQLIDNGDGYYQLATQVGNGLQVIDVAGGSSSDSANIQTWGNAKSDNQMFSIVPNTDGSFRILSKISGNSKCLDVSGASSDDGANVLQYTYKDSANQHWAFEKVDYTAPIVDGLTYYIKNVNSGLYLDVADGTDANGTNIQQFTGNGLTAQQFKAIDMGNGYFQLISQVGGATRAVDVSGNSPANGQNILIYDDTDSNNQQFKLKPVGNGSYAILTKCSEDASCIEVINAYTTNGANVQQWPYTGHNCQKWAFEIVR